MVAGALADAVLLVVLGGLLVTGVVVDAARTLGRLPRTSLHVEPDRIPEDSTALVRVEAKGVTSRHQLRVDLSPGLGLAEGASNVLEHDAREFNGRFNVVARVRGPQRVGPVVVREWSPLSLWASDRTVEAPHWLEVVPRVEDASKVGLASSILRPMQGRFNVNRPGQGMDFFALRGYQQGDTIRSINWKATARADDLIVNQRQRETHSQILLFLDARVVTGLGPLGRTPLDRGCRLVLGLYREALNARDMVKFYAYGNKIQDLSGVPAGQRLTALETLLARLPAAGMISLKEAWEEARTQSSMGAPIVVVTPAEADPGLGAAVAEMVARGHPVTVISPTPTGPDWDQDPARRERRERVLDEVRDKGAVLVDWVPDSQVRAERPAKQVQAVA